MYIVEIELENCSLIPYFVKSKATKSMLFFFLIVLKASQYYAPPLQLSSTRLDDDRLRVASLAAVVRASSSWHC